MADASDTIGHVKDATYFHFPRVIAGNDTGHVDIPQPFKLHEPIYTSPGGPADFVETFDLTITKFMVIETIAAVLIAVVFIRLAQKMQRSDQPKGRLWNMLEGMLVFVRDDIARAAIGKKDGDRFVPYLWTIFFFVLICNLMGMLPWSGSPTAAIGATGALALTTFGVVVGSATMKMGFVGFLKSQVPHMDLPGPMSLVMNPLIFVLELGGMFIKHFVLSVRLLANMFAGHLVLAVIIGFIAQVGSVLWFGVMPASIFGAVALSLLELLVAFIQAYIFAFLSALFISLAIHPH